MISILLVALALCVDSFVVSAAAAFGSSIPWRRGIVMAAIFCLCQGITPLLGALLGVAFQTIMAAIDHWVAFGLLTLVGCKMIVDAWRGDDSRRPMDTGKLGVMFLLGIATSIDAFVVGIGLGLENGWPYIIQLVVTVTVATFLLSLLGYLLGSRHILIPEKPAGIMAGLVLIGLGTYTLFEHLSAGC